jgi:plasmid maintenance system antidote protein VapI
MITPKTVKEIMQRFGLMNYKTAANSSLHPNVLANYLNNRDSLTVDQLARLEMYLDQFTHIKTF